MKIRLFILLSVILIAGVTAVAQDTEVVYPKPDVIICEIDSCFETVSHLDSDELETLFAEPSPFEVSFVVCWFEGCGWSAVPRQQFVDAIMGGVPPAYWGGSVAEPVNCAETAPADGVPATAPDVPLLQLDESTGIAVGSDIVPRVVAFDTREIEMLFGSEDLECIQPSDGNWTMTISLHVTCSDEEVAETSVASDVVFSEPFWPDSVFENLGFSTFNMLANRITNPRTNIYLLHESDETFSIRIFRIIVSQDHMKLGQTIPVDPEDPTCDFTSSSDMTHNP